MMKNKIVLGALLLFPLVPFAAGQMASDRVSDIRNTRHNFAATDVVELPGGAERNIKAAISNEVCVYCHTPHGNSAGDDATSINDANKGLPFLWNRQMPNASSFSKYESSSYDGGPQTLGSGSRMCLSCHDGTVAIGQVTVMNGRLTATNAAFSPDPNVVIPAGTDGYTSNLGVDLKNDHPVGFVYDSTLATKDGELQDPSTSALIGVRTSGGIANFNNRLANDFNMDAGTNPTDTLGNKGVALPLEPTVNVVDKPTQNSSFLTVAASGQVECTTCHDPHIRSTNTEENIKFLRLHRFQKTQPTALATGVSEPGHAIDSDINCVACHKKTGWSSSVHAQSANTYKTTAATLREFPADTTVWQASCLNCHDPHTETGASWLLRAGANESGKSAIEQTCYECHGPNPVINDDAGKAPADIQTLDALSGHESFDAANNTGTQLHNILSADLDETRDNLKANRHVTCSDCHNPHRILQNTAFDGTGQAGSSLHAHQDDTDHSNKLSGAMTGVSGVMVDSSAVTGFNPYSAVSGIAYTELKGVIDQAASNASEVVSKEYQVCMKCHSDYSDTSIGAAKANIAMEFSEAAVSFHPAVINSNSNNQADKADMSKTSSDNFVAPFNRAVGTQTLYCSDCHTNNVSSNPKGPHGSSVDKLLAADGDSLCVSCHKADQYQSLGATVQNSGFSCQSVDCTAGADTQNNNLHILHADKATNKTNICSDCHVAVPHGWKLKSLLVDLDDADFAGDTRYMANGKIHLNIDNNAYDTANSITAIPVSGNWSKQSCGTAGGCHQP